MSVIKLVCIATLVCSVSVLVDAQARRVRLRPRPAPLADDQLQYYEADPQEQEALLLQQEDLALYSRPSARADSFARPAPAPKPRTKESARTPPVQTIRNYNKVNDDGSFTFGYEAADGSFKEETRGTDCVVRGKYGYVDPDGNKREFTYVSGNPCDPNAPSEEDDDLDNRNEAPDSPNEPANYPVRPANYPSRPVRPNTTVRPTTTVFQNIYRQTPEPEVEEEEQEEPIRTIPPRPVAITPRPLPATTFRPALQITQRPYTTPRPQIVYSSVSPSSIATTPSSYVSSTRPSGHIDFAAEFAKFQQENQIISSTPSSFKTKAKTSETVSPTGNPVFSTQLVFDPASGQYDSRLFQTLPQTNGDFTLNHRVQPAVTRPQVLQQQPHLLQQQPHLLQQQSQGFRPSQLYTQIPQQARSAQLAFQRQQEELLFQNSKQLYAQQQQVQQNQYLQDAQATRNSVSQRPPQQFYYVAPGREQQSSPIDAFLRGHNIQF